MNHDTIQIVTAANKNYLTYLACHLLSLARLKTEQPMMITVIHTGIDPTLQEQLSKMIPAPHQLCWFEPSQEALEQINAPLDFVDLSPHYYRLLIPFLLPNSPRALYLDADTLVLKNLSQLWSLELGKSAAAAVQDYISCISEAVANWQDFNLDPTAPYFNSGVLLINLKRWRDLAISEQTLQICKKHAKWLVAQGKWPQYDQYGLNIALYKNWKILNKVWNYGTDSPPSDANVIHFIGNGKIGRPSCHPFFHQIFQEILKEAIPKSHIDLAFEKSFNYIEKSQH